MTGCSSIRLQKEVSNDKGNWQQYGGSIERTNVASTAISPPLTQVWDYDASAGFSEYSVSVADSVVFIGTLQGEVYAVQIRTGEKVGKYDFGYPVIGTPVVDDSMLYVAVANTKRSLYGYNIQKGKVAWRAELGGIETSPLLEGDNLYVATSAGEVYSIDKHTGSVNWKFVAPLFERLAFLHSSPASDGKAIVFGCDDGSLFCIGKENGQLIWHVTVKKSIFGSPSIREGKVFVGSQDENFYAFDLATGKILWTTPLGSRVYTSQAVDDTHVYVGTPGEELFCLDIATGKIIWRFRAKSVIACAPLCSGGIVYVGSLDKNLYALDALSGTMLWKYEAESKIKGMPVAWNDYLIILLDDRTVVALKQGAK